MLCTRSVSAIEIGPWRLSSLASAQSSIRAARIAARPPACCSASRRTSMQPPAAAAVRAPRIVGPGERIEHLEEENEGRHEHALGKTLAAQLRHQRSQHQAALFAPAPRDSLARPRHRRCRHRSGADRPAVPPRLTANSTPCCCAQSLPVQPAGSGRPGKTVSRSLAPIKVAAPRAISAVPSRLWSSTTITVKRAGIVLAQQRGDGLADALGLVARRE